MKFNFNLDDYFPKYPFPNYNTNNLFGPSDPELVEMSDKIKEKDYYICPQTGVIIPYTGRIDRNGYKYWIGYNNLDKKDKDML